MGLGGGEEIAACIGGTGCGVGGNWGGGVSFKHSFDISPVPGTVRMMSHRFGSLLYLGEERVFEKCDVQFFCFSISSRELNFRSGFSGFSGFGRLIL